MQSWAQSVRDDEQTFRVNVSPVTGNFFVVLGARAILGRVLVPDDDHPGAAPVAVLSYSLWRGQFAGNPGVLGRRLELRNSRVVTVVGVAPPGVEFPRGTELWVPFANLSAGEVVPLGRLSSHATAREAAAELRASFEREPTNEWRGLRAAAVPLPSLILGEVRPALLLLTVAAAVLLLTACFNVSNLLLLRGATRRQEMAVRQALGASHGRIIRLLLVESLPLALLASLVGAWVATELVRVLVALAPANIPRLEEVRLQGRRWGWLFSSPPRPHLVPGDAGPLVVARCHGRLQKWQEHDLREKHRFRATRDGRFSGGVGGVRSVRGRAPQSDPSDSPRHRHRSGSEPGCGCRAQSA
jgi:hypothetical protein